MSEETIMPQAEELPPGLPANCFFYVPVARMPNGCMVLSFEQARAAAHAMGIVNYRIAEWDHLSVDIASKRELFADRFLHDPAMKDCEYFLMVDDDMDFRIDPQCIAKLVLAAKKSGAHVIAPLMVRRDAPHWVAFNEKRGIPDDTMRAFHLYKNNEIIQVDGHVGTGCILVHRSVLEAVKPPWFRTVLTRRCQGSPNDKVVCRLTSEDLVADPACPACKGTGENPKGAWVDVGEDTFFCRKAHDAGFKVCLAAGVLLGHIGQVPFTIQDSIRQQFPHIHAKAMLAQFVEKAQQMGEIPPELLLPKGAKSNGHAKAPPPELVIAR